MIISKLFIPTINFIIRYWLFFFEGTGQKSLCSCKSSIYLSCNILHQPLLFSHEFKSPIPFWNLPSAVGAGPSQTVNKARKYLQSVTTNLHCWLFNPVLYLFSHIKSALKKNPIKIPVILNNLVAQGNYDSTMNREAEKETVFVKYMTCFALMSSN